MTAITECATLVDVLRHRSDYQSDRSAYIYLADGEQNEERLTYGQLDRRARAIASVLQQRVAPGERALLLYPPGLEYIAAFFGCIYAGVLAVPLYPPDPNRVNRTMPRIQAIAADAQAKVALTNRDIQAALGDDFFAQFGLHDVQQWLATDTIAEHEATNCRSVDIHGDTLAYLLYTSGSTGIPKGVVVNHRNILHNLDSIRQMCGHNEHSVHVSWLPIFHDFGLIVGTLEPLYTGFVNVAMSPLSFLERPYRWLAAITRYRGTTAGGPNFAYDLCVRKINAQQRDQLDLSSWTNAINGAEPVRQATLERFIEAFAPHGFRRETFNPSYGMTQATASITFVPTNAGPRYCTMKRLEWEHNRVTEVTPEDKDALTLVGCGHSLPGQRIAIVNPETLVECPEATVGEIWISGPSIGQGYWRRPDETEYFFQARLADTGEGPFLRTEDLGFIKDGELFITGRLKDLIIIRGLNHYPQDIEDTVEKINQWIRPGCCAAFSITEDDEERLIVVAEAERRYVKKPTLASASLRQQYGEIEAFNPEPEQPLDASTLMGDIRQMVTEQHDLKVYRVVLIKAGTIPKTSSGKIQRHACRKAFLSGTLDILAIG